jgi:PhoH-like ATPase
MQKIFVPDSNIIFDNGRGFESFQDNFVFMPSIVRQEADRMKKRMDDVGFNARLYLSTMEELSREHNLVVDGVPLCDDGRLFETFSYDYHGKDPLKYKADIGENDLDIIRAAMVLQIHNPDTHVEVVSHDRNVLALARYNGLHANPLTKSEVKVDTLPQGLETIVNADLCSQLYTAYDNIPLHSLGVDQDFLKYYDIDTSTWHNNKYVYFKPAIDAPDDFRLMFRYVLASDTLQPTTIKPFAPYGGIIPRNPEEYALMDAVITPGNSVVLAYGGAGTGKTLSMLASSFYLIKKALSYKESSLSPEDPYPLIGEGDPFLYVTKPAINVAGEEYGFLPGDLVEKQSQNYKGIDKNIRKIMAWWDPQLDGEPLDGSKKHNPDGKRPMADAWGRNLRQIEEKGLISIYPLGYFRGDTIMPGEILLIEEAQNIIPAVMRTIITRGETGSKTLITGDLTQIDNPLTRPEYSGLSTLLDAIYHRHDPKYDFMAAFKLTSAERGLQTEWADKYLGRSYR